MALTLNIPTKNVSDELTAPEFNLMVETIKEIILELNKVTHAFSETHFKEEGTTVVNGQAVPIIQVNVNLFNPDQFEMVNGVVSIKQSVLG